MTKTIKAKFKFGQMVWYIANGYVTNATVKAVFVDKWDGIQYSVLPADYEAGKHTIEDDNAISEASLYPSKKALIKSIENQEPESDE